MKRGSKLTICECIVAHVVARGIRKVKEQCSDSRSVVCHARGLGYVQTLERDCHGSKTCQHGPGRDHEHRSTLKSRHKIGGDGSIEKGPAGVCEINPCLGVVVGVAHHIIQQVLVV